MSSGCSAVQDFALRQSRQPGRKAIPQGARLGGARDCSPRTSGPVVWNSGFEAAEDSQPTAPAVRVRTAAGDLQSLRRLCGRALERFRGRHHGACPPSAERSRLAA